VKLKAEITQPLPDVDIPPVVQVGSGISPEARVERERRDARRQRKMLVVSLALMLAGVGLTLWIVTTR
jgi:hypothetical protein